MATMGYEIKTKEKAIQDLQKQNELLKIEAAQLRSMNNLETEKDKIKMQKPDEVSYIEVDNPVAMK